MSETMIDNALVAGLTTVRDLEAKVAAYEDQIQRITERLWKYGNDSGLCEEFDLEMTRVGLKGRPVWEGTAEVTVKITIDLSKLRGFPDRDAAIERYTNEHLNLDNVSLYRHEYEVLETEFDIERVDYEPDQY